MNSPAESPEAGLRSRPPVPFGDALRVWARIGLLSFGGPAGQIALMHKELVEKRKWIDEARFLHALNYCMLLPGPEAQQLATYVGWLMHRAPGGLAAGTLFVLPGFFVILGLSMAYAGLSDLPAVAALFFGLKAAVLSIVLEALSRIAKRALAGRFFVGLAVLSFVAIFFFEAPFPAIVLGAGLVGLVGRRLYPELFPDPPAPKEGAEHDTVIDGMAARGELEHTKPSSAKAVRTLVTSVVLFAAPVVGLAVAFGRDSVFVHQARFFGTAAVVTFGGAYSVLAFVAQRAVEHFHWLAPGEMVDGLGLAETTPGPLILVLEFVGFMGGFRHAPGISPWTAGLIGAGLTAWVTFVPCFLWIFLGAPYVEALRGNRALRAALSCITASVVGVIANLTIWFALHTLFREVSEAHVGPLRLLVPDFATFEPAAAVLAALAAVATFRLHLGMAKTLAGCAVLGLAWKLLAPMIVG